MSVHASSFILFLFFIVFYYNNLKDVLVTWMETLLPTTLLPSIMLLRTLLLPSPAANSTATDIMSLAKPFPDISKIEVFVGENFKRWQERNIDVLDMYRVVWVLIDIKTNDNAEAWTHVNKVWRHFILSTLSNELFDVYCSYNKANEIWSNMVTNYTVEDVGNKNLSEFLF